MGATNFSNSPIHRPAETDTNRADGFTGRKFRNGGANLLPNARATARLIHIATFAAQNLPIGIAENQLQLRAADFNAKEHAAIKHAEVRCLKAGEVFEGKVV